MYNGTKYELIVIGGSSGGFEEVTNILPVLPPGLRVPVIIILHRLRNDPGDLPGLLQRYTPIPVSEPEDKEPVSPGHIYVAPSNYHILIEADRTFSYHYGEPVNYSRPSIDLLFETAAEVYEKSLIGILLSGANSDGANGLYTVSLKGGVTLAREPDTSVAPFMPAAAIQIFQPGYILPVAGIASQLIKLIHE